MLFLVASASVASPDATATPPLPVQAVTLAPVAKPRRVCHFEDAVTGSITPKRVCVTVPQAAPAPVAPQDAARDKAQQNSSSGSGTNN